MKFSVILILIQLLFIILYAVLVDYGDMAKPHKEGNSSKFASQPEQNDISVYYPMFQDVHVMIYVGFGFLMTFLKKYGYGAVGYNFFIAALVAQWATFVLGIFHQMEAEGLEHIQVNIQTLVTADFAAAAVLITYGAVLGKISRLQLLLVGMLEVIFYAINEWIAVKYLKISDAGGSMIIHAFGAYFGLAVARVYYRKVASESEKEGSVYHSDLFAMIGTIFLWLFWPSFNGCLVAPDYLGQHRAVINTYFSLCAACIASFAVSPILDKKYRLNMVHIQNATLAGGVAIGTACNMFVYPWGALLIGALAGALSTVGYAFITPFFTDYLKCHDTCGVHNLHGMPAVLAAIAGAVTASHAEANVYSYDGLYSIFSARAPALNTTAYDDLLKKGVTFTPGDGRSAKEQAGFQIAALGVTLGIALLGGMITGLVTKWSIFDVTKGEQLFDDEDFWEVPEEGLLPVSTDGMKEDNPKEGSIQMAGTPTQ